MSNLDRIVISLVSLWFFTHWGYLAGASLQRAYKTGELGNYWKILAGGYVLMVLFLIADVLFNWVFMTVAMREFPKEWLTTSRVQRLRYRLGWRGVRANWFADKLNVIAPGHIH